MDNTKMMQRFLSVSVLAASLLFSTGLYAEADCKAEQYQQLEPLLGLWDEYQISDAGREHIGTLLTERVAGGCAFRQSFQGPDGSFSFASFGYVDTAGAWKETYVLSNGRVAEYSWRGEGEELIMDRLLQTPDAPLKRLRLFDISAQSYFVADEESLDGGKTWSRRELVHTVRKVHQPGADR